jgi:hypothetical protein
VIDEIRIAGQVPAVEHLVLVAHVHVEVLTKRFVDAEKESVLIDSGSGTFAGRHAIRVQAHMLVCCLASVRWKTLE